MKHQMLVVTLSCPQSYVYVNSNGAVYESFIRFSDVSKDRNAAAISDLVVKELKEFDCLNK